MQHKTDHRPRPHAGRIIATIILAGAIIVCGYSAYNIISILTEDAQSDAVTVAMRSYAQPVDPAGAAKTQAALDPVVRPEPPGEPVHAGSLTPADDSLSIDFAGLQALNDEICAWIDIPGTDISYPVAQTDNNDYYLTHSADGSRNRAGAIFLDARSDSSFTGRNTIVYGHRMNNGSMFGSLHELAGGDHPVINIYLPGAPSPLRYEVVGTWESSASLDSAAYQVDFADDAAYSEWLAGLEVSADAALSAQDRILTLSTCVRGDGDARFIVAARQIS